MQIPLTYRISGDRYTTVHTAAGYNWVYKTMPQKSLKGQQIDYSRGKGIGGFD